MSNPEIVAPAKCSWVGFVFGWWSALPTSLALLVRATLRYRVAALAFPARPLRSRPYGTRALGGTRHSADSLRGVHGRSLFTEDRSTISTQPRIHDLIRGQYPRPDQRGLVGSPFRFQNPRSDVT
jgi:hypothetical protein